MYGLRTAGPGKFANRAINLCPELATLPRPVPAPAFVATPMICLPWVQRVGVAGVSSVMASVPARTARDSASAQVKMPVDMVLRS